MDLYSKPLVDIGSSQPEQAPIPEVADVSAPTEATPTTPIATKPTTPEIDPKSYLGGLLSNNQPKPTYNQKSEDQLKNMAKAQKIGEFLGLLGDVYGASKGATIQKRESQSAAPYMQSILARQDKYKEQLDQFQKEQYLKKLQIGQAFDAENKYNVEQEKWQKTFEANQDYKKYLQATKQADTIESKRRFELQEKDRQAQIKIAKERADKSGRVDKTNAMVDIQTTGGVHTLNPAGRDFKARQAMANPEVIKRHPEYFTSTSKFEGGKYVTEHKLNDSGTPNNLAAAQLEIEEESKGVKPQGQASPSEFSAKQEKALSILHKNNPTLSRQQILELIPKE